MPDKVLKKNKLKRFQFKKFYNVSDSKLAVCKSASRLVQPLFSVMGNLKGLIPGLAMEQVIGS